MLNTSGHDDIDEQNSSSKRIRFDLNKSVRVTRIFARENHRITKNDPIFTMVDAENAAGKKETFSSGGSGTVTKLYIHENDVLSRGYVILEYEECRHTMILINLCCDCGIDVRQLNDENSNARPIATENMKNSSNKSNGAAATISMIHKVPDLKMTFQEAEKLCIKERDQLLRQRKLDLLVDLDQTVLHTTNFSNYYPSSPDVIAYQLNHRIAQTFYTKLRPGLKEFLTNLLPYYRFHIITFGERLYAHTMAKLIDPDEKFFYDRILSRDESLDPTRKTANLNALFPCGDSMVCIIDDREDVWNYAQNLIHVKPYVWFKDVGDINGTHLPSPPIPNEQLIPPISEKEFEEQLGTSEQIAAEELERESHALLERTTEEGYQMAISRGEKRKLDEDLTNETSKVDETKKKLKDEDGEVEEPMDESKPMHPVDNDRYLIQLEALLKRVHSEFYALYDQWLHDKNRLMPDLKQILPDFRRRVLQNVSLCFSHLMPQGYPLEKHRGTIISRAMGATVTADLQIDDQGRCLTTHVVAGKRTSKVERALRYNIHVVTPEWLIDCYEQWERKDEVIYPLTIDYDVKKSRLFTRETPRYAYNETNVDNRPKPSVEPSNNRSQTSNDDETTTAKPNYSFSISVDELDDMKKEMKEFLDEDDADDDENENENETEAPVTTNPTTDASKDVQKAESDSSAALRQMTLDEDDLNFNDDKFDPTDEESLSDGDAPLGWKEKPKIKKFICDDIEH